MLQLPINRAPILHCPCCFTYIVEQGWHDQDFIEAHTLRERRIVHLSSRHGARPTDVRPVVDLRERWTRRLFPRGPRISAAFRQRISARPLNGLPSQRRTATAAVRFIGYEKGIIWSNDNYRSERRHP